MLEASRLDASKPADLPLTADEAAEMRGHLRFLFKHRKDLRLKVNAAEDLLLNGSREPTHRGICLHLLSKVDLSSIESALTRLTEPRARAELLSGITRFSTDAGVLLLYLESLTLTSSRAEAAAALDAAVRRIDFAQISAARMRRILDLIAANFEGHERLQALSGFLRSRSFRDALDASAEKLPDALADVFVPLRAVHEAIFEGLPNRFGPDVLAEGVAVVLGAPEAVLRAFPEPLRVRLLESAVKLVADATIADRAEDVLLDSLPTESRSFSALGMLRAGELLARHEDERARPLLARIRDAHPGFRMPARWLAALDAPRLGRFAVLQEDGAVADGARRRFERAFWLDGQRTVWLRVGEWGDAERLAEEARLQRDLALPGLAPVLDSGVADDGTPFLSMPAIGRPLAAWLRRRRAERTTAIAVALQGVQVLQALTLVGLQLPDVSPDRFLIEDAEHPLLLLADLGGARRVTPADSARSHRTLATALCRTILDGLREGDIPVATRHRIDGARDLPGLVVELAAAL